MAASVPTCASDAAKGERAPRAAGRTGSAPPPGGAVGPLGEVVLLVLLLLGAGIGEADLRPGTPVRQACSAQDCIRIARSGESSLLTPVNALPSGALNRAVERTTTGERLHCRPCRSDSESRSDAKGRSALQKLGRSPSSSPTTGSGSPRWSLSADPDGRRTPCRCIH